MYYFCYSNSSSNNNNMKSLNGKDPVPCFDQKKGGVGNNCVFKE